MENSVQHNISSAHLWNLMYAPMMWRNHSLPINTEPGSLTVAHAQSLLLLCPLSRKPSTCSTMSRTELWARPYGRTSSLRLTPLLQTRASQAWTWGSADWSSTLRYELCGFTRLLLTLCSTTSSHVALWRCFFCVHQDSLTVLEVKWRACHTYD